MAAVLNNAKVITDSIKDSTNINRVVNTYGVLLSIGIDILGPTATPIPTFSITYVQTNPVEICSKLVTTVDHSFNRVVINGTTIKDTNPRTGEFVSFDVAGVTTTYNNEFNAINFTSL